MRALAFYVDGESMKKYENVLPEEHMKLYVNIWFPTWLSGKASGSDRYAYVYRIGY